MVLSRTSPPAAAAQHDARDLQREQWIKPLHSALRYPTAALAVAAGLVHVPVTPDHLVEAPYVGVLFIALTVSSLLLAGLLLLADSPAAWVLSGVTCGLAVVAYVASRSVALPQMADDVGNWLEPLGMAALLTEGAVVVLSLVALRNGPVSRS